MKVYKGSSINHVTGEEGGSEFLEKTSRKRHEGGGGGAGIFKTHKKQF